MLLRILPVMTALIFAAKVEAFPEKDKPLTSTQLAEAKAETEGALRDVHPKPKKNPPQTSFKEDTPTLWGNLFGDGRIFAVTVGKHGVNYAEWEKEGWVFRGVFQVEPAWILKGQTAEDSGYSHVMPHPPSLSPFILKDVNGDGLADLLITFKDDGFQLGYAIAIYSPESHRLKLLDRYSDHEEPEYRAGYLVTHSDSGRKAWWGEASFYQWKGANLIWKASWRDDCTPPEHEVSGVTLITMPGLRHEKNRVFELESAGGGEGYYDYVVRQKESEMGTIRFRYHVPPNNRELAFENSLNGAETLWLFEAFTHLPWQTADKMMFDGPPKDAKKLQSKLRVEVKGSKELLELLEPALKEVNGKHRK